MSELTIVIEDESKTKFIRNLLREFEYVKIQRKKSLHENGVKKLSSEDKRILQNLEKAVEECNLAKQGKVQLQSADDYIKELQREGFL